MGHSLLAVLLHLSQPYQGDLSKLARYAPLPLHVNDRRRNSEAQVSFSISLGLADTLSRCINLPIQVDLQVFLGGPPAFQHLN